MSSVEGLAWLEYEKRHLLVSLLPPSLYFSGYLSSMVRLLTATTSIDSVKLSVFFHGKVVRKPVESFSLNVSIFDILFLEVERFQIF